MANHRLFYGILDKYLRSCAVMPTNEPGRNDTIVGELMTGKIDWVIYPEGGLVKSKRVVEGNRLMLDLPHRTGPPRTGGAVMALSAEIYKRRYLRALEEENRERAETIASRFGFEDVDDLCQKVWLSVREALGRYDPERASFTRWLEIIARRKAISEREGRQRRQRLIQRVGDARSDETNANLAGEHGLDDRELLAVIRSCAEELRGREREVFCLRYYCDLSTEQIANACDISEQRVRGALTEARKKLAGCLQHRGFV